MKILILSVSLYSLTNKDTGELVAGKTTFYTTQSNQHPIKLNIPYDSIDYPNVTKPGIYECEYSITSNSKGIAKLVPTKFKFISPFEVSKVLS